METELEVVGKDLTKKRIIAELGRFGSVRVVDLDDKQKVAICFMPSSEAVAVLTHPWDDTTHIRVVTVREKGAVPKEIVSKVGTMPEFNPETDFHYTKCPGPRLYFLPVAPTDAKIRFDAMMAKKDEKERE